ncbi:hypothetical protein TNCV_92591 [Trichonephila clavipes]|nr:hypothetical protein TNCV_92591 [Trichonephila clavipes]
MIDHGKPDKAKPRQQTTQMTSPQVDKHLIHMAVTEGIVSCVGTTLEHIYRCVIVCPHCPSTSSVPLSTCKDSSMQDYLDAEPLTSLATMDSSTQPMACRLATSCLFRLFPI